MPKNKRPRLLDVLNNPSSSDTIVFNPSSANSSTLASLLPSALRPPDCPAGDRIRVWRPKNARHTLDHNGQPLTLNEQDLARIKNVLQHTFAPNTRNSYGSGLLVFHVFCYLRGIDEDHRAPVNPTVLSSFISTLASSYGGSTIKNYVYGLRSWHIIHGLAWTTHDNEVEALLKAANKLLPRNSRQNEKPPWTIRHLTTLCEALDQSDPKDAAVLACLTTAFWGTTRLGEVTVPKLNGFNPHLHVKASDIRQNVRDRNDCEETIIFIPWTKAAQEKGENIFWAKQDGPSDPQHALQNHLKVNSPDANDHLFSFKHANGRRPMTRSIFITRINQLISKHSLPEDLTGHGIRIGSTLEYLLRGIPFDVIKSKGRWQSNAFQGYLRKHAQIMAPYMQAQPRLHDSIVRYSMPPVR